MPLSTIVMMPGGSGVVAVLLSSVIAYASHWPGRQLGAVYRLFYKWQFAPTRARSRSNVENTLFWSEGGACTAPKLRGKRRAMSDGVWAALSAVAVAVIGPTIAYKLKQKTDREAAKVFKAGLEDTKEVIDILHGFSQWGVDRAILWAGHNGGGLPSGGSPFYTSAVHWDVAPGHPDVINNYRNLLVDGAYVSMLIDSIDAMGRAKVLTTAKMRPCQLRRYYEAEQITSSLIIGMGIKDAKYYYLSLARYAGAFEANQITFCELQAATAWRKLTGQDALEDKEREDGRH